MTPGFAIKFTRDNLPSCNFMAMPSLDGQSSMNPFANNYSNHVNPPSALPLKVLAKKFLQASNCPTMLGLSDCTTSDSRGVAVEYPVFPYQLQFVPTAEVQCEKCTVDNVFGFLENIPVGTKIFDVYAFSSPND